MERAKASTKSKKMLESLSLSDTSVSLDISNIHGQYDGAAVIPSARASVHAKIKEVAPLAMYTHCHCHSVPVHATSKVSELRNR